VTSHSLQVLDEYGPTMVRGVLKRLARATQDVTRQLNSVRLATRLATQPSCIKSLVTVRDSDSDSDSDSDRET
jgi:hypothetical protein